MKKIININFKRQGNPDRDEPMKSCRTILTVAPDILQRKKVAMRLSMTLKVDCRMLHDKIRKGAANATGMDVDEIIASMGKVEDFEAADASEPTEPNSQSAPNFTWREQKQTKGRLYRDSSDRFIGGVCSGIAAYMNVDPAIVRILFAIITFGGFGLGFLAYILLWIILPPKDLDGYSGKRLPYPDDVNRGVAAALGLFWKKHKPLRLFRGTMGS